MSCVPVVWERQMQNLRKHSRPIACATATAPSLADDARDVHQTHPRPPFLSERFNQRNLYDSTYAALAELRGAEFWTAAKALRAVSDTLRPCAANSEGRDDGTLGADPEERA
jgi:hypothetical protein